MNEYDVMEALDQLEPVAVENTQRLTEMLRVAQNVFPEIVAPTWRRLVDRYWDQVVRDVDVPDSIGYFLTNGILRELVMDEGILRVENYIAVDDRLPEAIFRYSPVIGPEEMSLIAGQFKRKHFDTAGKMLDFMLENKKHDFITPGESGATSYSGLIRTLVKDFVLNTRRYYGEKGERKDEFTIGTVYVLEHFQRMVPDREQEKEIDYILTLYL